MDIDNRGRARFGVSCAYVLAGICAVGSGSMVAHAQTAVDTGRPNNEPVTQADRVDRAERARAADVAPRETGTYEEHHRPGEMYMAGFGGYTFGGGSSFTNAQVSGTPSRGFNLNDSGIYGLKIGYFMPDRLNWLGFEVEGFNTSPNIKPVSIGAGGTSVGASLRVTTVAFNAIIRGKFACGPLYDEPSRRTTTESHRDAYGRRAETFCPLQPYVGAGIGVFFAHTNGFGGGTSSSDNAVPGFNGLAGLRYFMTEHIALFGEYKYNRATFNFNNVSTPAGFSGDYSVHNVVGGLSFHF